jgi:hypothetical protein
MDERRSMSKGQRAMVKAMRYPDAKQGRPEKGKRSVSEPFSRGRLSEARTVLHHSRSLAESVVKGITALDVALVTSAKV